MTPNDLYSLPPAEIETEIWRALEHMPEIDRYRLTVDIIPGMEMYIYAAQNLDGSGERTWDLYSVWMDKIPFMICHHAGRGRRDYIQRFITNRIAYMAAVNRIQSLYTIEDFDDLCDASKDNPDLTKFYNHELSDFYDKDLEPKYKVGDVVMVSTKENHLDYRSGRILARVRIEQVHKFNPHWTYNGTQIDRRWNNEPIGSVSRRIIEDRDNGHLGCQFNDSQVQE